MKTLLNQDNYVQREGFGMDPILIKKKGLSNPNPLDIQKYKEKIHDESYMNHAIDRIAMELLHFLSK